MIKIDEVYYSDLITKLNIKNKVALFYGGNDMWEVRFASYEWIIERFTASQSIVLVKLEALLRKLKEIDKMADYHSHNEKIKKLEKAINEQSIYNRLD